MMRHVTSLLVNVVLVDYILPEFCHCLIFLFKKIGAGFYSPTPNIIEPKQKEYIRVKLSEEETGKLYKKRKIDVEPVFGFLKANLSFSRFSVRRKSKVENELGFA